jgi:ribonuclease HII
MTTRQARALAKLNDSKQHSAAAREELYPLVLESALRVAVVSRCVGGIDSRGLHKTNLTALADAARRVTRDLDAEADVICLTDGFAVAELGRPQRAVVNGDATSAAIAAASILAKVTRDRYMLHADDLHPGWSFAEHVGYSTPEHRDAILRLGVSPLHRMSFQSLAYQQLALAGV